MSDQPSLGYPGSVWSPAQAFTPSQHVNRLHTSPNAVRIQWWQAVPDPTFDKSAGRGTPSAGRGEWTRELQSGDFWAILSESPNLLKRFYPQGEWDQGACAVAFDPLQTPLSIYDHISPLGDGPDPAVLPGGRVYTEKETLVRGSVQTPAAGTLSTTGNAATGVGTAFTTLFQVGDVLWVGADGYRVAAIADDTHLTLGTTPARAYAGRSYAKGTDPTRQSLLAAVSLCRGADGTVYVFGTDFAISQEGTSLQWLSAVRSPAPGQTYSVIYDYRPRYELTGLGQRGQTVRGVPLLSVQACSLWTPEDALQR